MQLIYIILTVVAATQAISGGHNTTISRHRRQASFRHNGKHFCGAVIIDKDWGITTAHCLDHHTTNLSIYFGSVNLTAHDGFEINIRSFVKHPRYNRRTQDSDIALLKFARSIQNDLIYKALLPFVDTSDVPTGDGLTMTGWGATENGGAFSDVLQMGYPSIISRAECQVAYPAKVISLNMFCAGKYNVQTITACNGDYGGSASIHNCVQGIMSWGGICGNNRSPTVMTRVAGFKDWILSTTGISNYLVCPRVV